MQRCMSSSVVIPEYTYVERTIEPRSSRRVGPFSSSRSRAAAGESDDVLWHVEAGYLFTVPPVPASRKAMKGLHVPAVGKTTELVCAVCLDDFEVGDKLRTMPCTHSFHQRCIFPWLPISRYCPCCRFPLPSVDEQRVLDELQARAQGGSGNDI